MMFQRHQTTEDYRVTSQAESDDEDEDGFLEQEKSSMSRTTIGVIGGLMTMISAFAFYKAQ